MLDVSAFKHRRINYSKYFGEEKNRINGIENFWNQANRHLCRFNGIQTAPFLLFLKECEWRFNAPQPKITARYYRAVIFKYLFLGRLVGVEPTTSAATERRSATEL